MALSMPPPMSPSVLGPLEDQQAMTGAFLAGELPGPILARTGEADLVRVLVQLVDAQHLVALALAPGADGVDLLGLLRRIDHVGARGRLAVGPLVDVLAALDRQRDLRGLLLGQ